MYHYVAVVYDGRALDVPYIRAPISYNVVLSGGFDRRQAEDVAVVLWGGNLPAPVEVLEEGTYTP
jgi:preprotein translocase subunit SecD